MKYEVNISKKLEAKILSRLKKAGEDFELGAPKKDAVKRFMKETLKDFVSQLDDGDLISEMVDGLDFDTVFEGTK